MRYVEMTGTDLHVSAICLGTGALGSTVPQQEAFELLDLFLELGASDEQADFPYLYASALDGWVTRDLEDARVRYESRKTGVTINEQRVEEQKILFETGRANASRL